MARKNITKGPTIQFWVSERLKSFRFLKTNGSFSYFTFASGGYIIKTSPTAMGILVVPELNEFQKPDIPGIKYPVTTPANMTRNIQRVR
jgi:hypothetical protein